MALLYKSARENFFSSRDAMHALPIPKALGRFHNPTPFADFADLVADELAYAGLRVVNEEYAVAKDNGKFFGAMTIKPLEGELITSDDWELIVGLRGSHDQTLPRGLSIGTRVMVCSNLCFSGDLGVWHTKQTSNSDVRLPRIVNDAVSLIPAMAQRENGRRDAYRLRELKPRHGDAALVEVYTRGGLTAPQLGHAIDQWHAPVHAEHAEDGYTVWRAWNAVTEALKPTGNNSNMITVRDRSEIATRFFDEVAGLAA